MTGLLRFVSSLFVASAVVLASIGGLVLFEKTANAQSGTCSCPNGTDCPRNNIQCKGTVSYVCSQCTCQDITPTGPFRTWVCIH